MAEFTTRRGLEVPEGGDPRSTLGVGPVPIRAAIQALDGTLDYLEGLASARPAASFAGRLYRATDTGEWSVDTGSAWVKVMTGSILTGDIANGAVTAAKIGDSQVITAKIGNGQVTTPKLSDGAVTTAKLPDGAVTTAKVGDSQVTEAKIANLAVTGPKIAAGAVDNTRLENGGIAAAATIPLGSGWSAAGASHHTPTAQRDVTGRIYLRGLAATTGASTTLGTLPVGFRPWAQESFVAMIRVGGISTERKAIGVLIGSSGTIDVTNTSPTWSLSPGDHVSLSGISFHGTA